MVEAAVDSEVEHRWHHRMRSQVRSMRAPCPMRVASTRPHMALAFQILVSRKFGSVVMKATCAVRFPNADVERPLTAASRLEAV